MLAMRTATHAAIGKSPFQVMFGRESHPLANYAILDWAGLLDEKEDSPAWQLAVRRVIQMHDTLREEGRASASSNAEKAASVQRGVQDASHKVVGDRLAMGTAVCIRQVHPAHKLEHRFVGRLFLFLFHRS